MISGINHLTIAVKDLERSFTFYRDVLGFTPLMRHSKGAYFLAGESWFCLDLDSQTRTAALPEYTHFAFSISQPNFVILADRIRSSGAKIWRDNKSEGDSLYFLDPDHHKLEIHVGDWKSRIKSAKEKPWNDSVHFFEAALRMTESPDLSMYSPSHYVEKRDGLIFQVMEKYNFATLITQSPDGSMVSHLPLLLEFNEGVPKLVGHCAKGNLQWKHLEEGRPVTIVFQGPHSYISPAWYQPKPDNVPTWNYVAVHVEGKAKVQSNPRDAYTALKKLVGHFEDEYQTGWLLPEKPNEELKNLVNGIVAFEIRIEKIQAKFKLSQKQNRVDRDNVVAQLSKMGPEQKGVAEFMSKVLDTNS